VGNIGCSADAGYGPGAINGNRSIGTGRQKAALFLSFSPRLALAFS